MLLKRILFIFIFIMSIRQIIFSTPLPNSLSVVASKSLALLYIVMMFVTIAMFHLYGKLDCNERRADGNNWKVRYTFCFDFFQLPYYE